MLSNYLANALLDHAIGRAAYAMPASVYLAAYTAAPGVDGGGTEAGWPGYARTLIPPASIAAPVAGVSINAAALNSSVNDGAAVTITHLATFDALAGGNLLEYWPLTAPVLLATGQRLAIAAGDFVRRAANEAAAPVYTPGLAFADARNSQYIAAIAF